MSLVVSPQNKQQTLKELLTKATPAFRSVLVKHMTADRLVKIALSAVSRSPDLLDCTPESILKCVMQAAEVGLEFTALGEAYMVPFWNRKMQPNRREALFIPGYKGLINLARRSGEVSSVEAHVVYEKDTYDIEYGLNQKLVHKPFLAGDRGKPLLVYAICRFKDGGQQLDVMTADEVEKTRKRSPAGNSGPWQTDTSEMWRKTVVRRLAKYLPLSPELRKVMSHEDAADRSNESGDDLPPIFEADFAIEEQNPQEPQNRGQDVASRIKVPEGEVKS